MFYSSELQTIFSGTAIKWSLSEKTVVKITGKLIMYVWQHRQFIIFIVGGGVGALTNWLISFFLTSIEGMHYIISFSIAQSINITVNFIWHARITFRVSDKSGNRFVKFIILSTTTAGLSIGLVYFVKEYFIDRIVHIVLFGYTLNYLATIIIITFFVALINFTISKHWVFQNNIGAKND
jgi:putative flippase GtrA